MTFTEFTYLLIALAVLLVYGVAVYVAWRALFRDRPNGRRRCPRCWHDMTFTEGMRCTECGFIARKEKQFARTRRRTGVAAVSMGVCVALALGLYYKLADQNVLRYVPSAMLLPALPISGSGSAPIPTEVMRRATRDQLTESQWHRLVLRATTGDWGARPPDDDWVDKYSRIIAHRAWEVRSTPDLDWPEDELEAVQALPPKVSLATRSTWPAGSTPSVQVRLRDWWPDGDVRRVRITPQVPDAKPTILIKTARSRFRDAVYITVPGVDHDQEVEFEVEVEVPVSTDSGEDRWESKSIYTTRVDFDFDADVAVIDPVEDAALTEIIRATFSQGAIRWQSGRQPVRFQINTPITFGTELTDTAIGVHIDLLRDGVIARRLNVWWLAGPGLEPRQRAFGSEQTQIDLEMLRDTTMGDTSWSLRITADRDLALRAGNAGQYWRGRITLPVSVTDRGNDAPGKPWMRAE